MSLNPADEMERGGRASGSAFRTALRREMEKLANATPFDAGVRPAFGRRERPSVYDEMVPRVRGYRPSDRLPSLDGRNGSQDGHGAPSAPQADRQPSSVPVHRHGPRQVLVHGDNWHNYLAGISYLETTHHDEGNRTSSAHGYFQFLRGTAERATKAGLPDPRRGSYAEQAAATREYIQRFHPEAAKAIERGDYASATRLLRGEWPSLPGGSQQQRASRYDTWREVLAGRGPRPPGSATQQTSQPRAAAAAPAPARNSDTSGQRIVGGVDPRIQEIVNAAATHLPQGYRVEMSSGYRGAHVPNHNGRAADYHIVGPDGRVLPNRGEDPSGMYQTLARHAYGEMLARHPDLRGQFAWGGAFGTQLGGGGPRDLMHFDINGERGRYVQHRLSNLGPMPGVSYGPQKPAVTASELKPTTGANNERSDSRPADAVATASRAAVGNDAP